MALWTAPASAATAPLDYPWQNLPWPIELNRWPHQFGANFGQFQDLGSRYFHGGQDILSFPGADVRTPVAGTLGGGFYSYRDLPNGHTQKNLVSLKEHLENGVEPPWGNRYFEVSVTTPEGYRFEFHHVDPLNLPENVRQGIINGAWISAGEVVGHVVNFEHEEYGVRYDHIHYNVYGPDDRPLNPLLFTKSLKDTTPPVISLVGYGGEDRCRSQLGQFYHLHGPSTEFIPSDSGNLVVQVSDLIDGNIISQGPTFFSVEFVGHSSVVYDTRVSLFDAFGFPYDIKQMFQEEMCVGVPEMALACGGLQFHPVFYESENTGGLFRAGNHHSRRLCRQFQYQESFDPKNQKRRHPK